MISLHAKSVEDTKDIAARIAELLEPGDLILASGDLGAGKTTFTQGLGAALGIEDRITSPTFVLMCEYEGRLPLHHVDVYRLDQLQEVLDLGLLELLDDGGVGLIEWGEVALPVLGNEHLLVRLLLDDDDDARNLEITTAGPKWKDRDAALIATLSRWIVEPQ